MAVVWLTPGPEANWTDYTSIVDGWRPGEPFHRSESSRSESPYVSADGRTRLVIYHPTGVSYGGERAIAVIGAEAERVADRIAGRLAIHARRSEPVFHRHRPQHTAGCAGEDGVWVVDSVDARVLWHALDGTRRVIAAGVYAPVAIAGDARGLYVTSCDEPRASRLARIDPATGTVTWLCDGLDRPQQLAVLGGIAHVACPSGLVSVDAAGAVERHAPDVAPPHLLAAGDGALVWIDEPGRHVVHYAGGHAEVIATGESLIALDVDHDRAYALERDGRVLECRRGRPARTLGSFQESWQPWYAGILRLGPFAVTAVEWESSWHTRTKYELLTIGVPLVDEAPGELRAQLAAGDEAAWDVLADWLGERGVVTTPAALRHGPAGSHDGPDGRGGSIAGGIARELVSCDREVGYRVSGREVEVIRASDWY